MNYVWNTQNYIPRKKKGFIFLSPFPNDAGVQHTSSQGQVKLLPWKLICPEPEVGPSPSYTAMELSPTFFIYSFTTRL
jgi:hypothetical protein